jgi:hypothetical protein
MRIVALNQFQRALTVIGDTHLKTPRSYQLTPRLTGGDIVLSHKNSLF